MRLPGRKVAAVPVAPAPEPEVPTVGKGRPTPKRRDAQARRGPVAPPPRTQREALARSKANRASMSKGERRVAASERRERMMRGDDAYVLPRDRGPVRAFVRDLIDTRRNVAGILLPVAILSFILVIALGRSSGQSSTLGVLTNYGPLILIVAFLVALVDTVLFTRQARRRIAVKFPQGDPSGLSTRGRSLVFYSFNRAIFPRRWRIPRPRVKPGDQVT